MRVDSYLLDSIISVIDIITNGKSFPNYQSRVIIAFSNYV